MASTPTWTASVLLFGNGEYKEYEVTSYEWTDMAAGVIALILVDGQRLIIRSGNASLIITEDPRFD